MCAHARAVTPFGYCDLWYWANAATHPCGSGAVAFCDLRTSDFVLTARGTWKKIERITSRPFSDSMLDMGDDELSTMGHLTLLNEKWIYMLYAHPEFWIVSPSATVHNLEIECDADDDGTASDTEHSYTLANGLVVHNVNTN